MTWFYARPAKTHIEHTPQNSISKINRGGGGSTVATVALPPPDKNTEGFEPEREGGSRQWLHDALDRRALRCGVRPVVSTTPSTVLRQKKSDDQA
ncbi:hypothetical protein K0M31_004357 [Melipona bicolor]|uniref:Uncharacterized protein n=1 Tax=Melipona bicolor TaxID=60889 RepID=A0AA40FWM5_9HYME|nr:hypothetical protein K0M31_004357 [Melipona bicolor]